MNRNKYFNHKLRTAFGDFDSKAEYERWWELKDKQKNGEIFGLKRQVEYEVLPARFVTKRVQLKTKFKDVIRMDERPIKYTADFVYCTNRHGYVEDVKGKYTKTLDDYIMRRKLMKRLLDQMNEKLELADENGDRITDYWLFVEKVY